MEGRGNARWEDALSFCALLTLLCHVVFDIHEEEETESGRRLLQGQLSVQLPKREPIHYPLYRGENSIGRLDSNDICILDPTVSSRHAQLILEPQGAILVDLGSTNKTRRTESFSDLRHCQVLQKRVKVRSHPREGMA